MDSNEARHYPRGTSEAKRLDPYENYLDGVIVNPDEVVGSRVRVGRRWANCHPPNGVNLHAYGVRWWL